MATSSSNTPCSARQSVAALCRRLRVRPGFFAGAAAGDARRSRATSGACTIPVVIKEGATYYRVRDRRTRRTGHHPDQDVNGPRGAGRTPATSCRRFLSGRRGRFRRRATPGRPDIALLNGKYHLYYSVSSFGSRNSAIGLATNRTLDPASPDYRWVDEGMVLRSFVEKDDWNAIDPNLVIEDAKNVWLTWGSFWGGIKMRRIDPATGKLSDTDATMHALSSRAREQPIERLGRGAVHRAPRRLLVSVRLVRPLLPRRREHLQRRGRPRRARSPDRTSTRPGRR